jgi:hypothetical protein
MYNGFKLLLMWQQPITMATQSKAWIVFAHSKTGIMGSNPTQDMDVRLRLSCVCVGNGLATG